MLANQALSFLVSGQSPGRLGNAHPTVVPYRVFEASDGPVVIAVGNNGQFATLCAVLGIDELGNDPLYRTNSLRVLNRVSLEETLGRVIRTQSVNHLVAALSARQVPCGPVNTIAQAFGEPTVAAHNLVHHFVRQDGVSVPSVSFPGALSETPARFDRMPPRLGEHTGEILESWLGLEGDELQHLKCLKVVADESSS
jgi:crotonobetainyl-CoA:carnitine CoA-transferase CaiB-like acyl-CoA transferase